MLATRHFNYSGIMTSCNHNTMEQKPEGERTGTNGTAPSPTAAGISMSLGILFNVVALIILVKAYNRFRRRSKATFLLLASSLVATDLAGHIISGALVLSRYSASTNSTTSNTSNPDVSCRFLGGSMVFFGLCPLFLGCAMAAERCLGITRPLVHARLVTTARTKMALTMSWFLALCVALLPFFNLGDYTLQHPGTWCFITVMGDIEATDLAFMMLFSGLALSSLALAFVCNTISGIKLVTARLKKKSCSQRFSARAHDTEMVVQLVGIMVTSCICWSPLLIFGLISATGSYTHSLANKECTYKRLMVTSVRMATCNQILDPWVYILLRRAILRKIYRITKKQASSRGSTLRSIRWDISSLQNSEKNCIKNV
ncbi:prostaglandin E receptor 1b (subtype EP1) [Xenentodon cancila]